MYGTTEVVPFRLYTGLGADMGLMEIVVNGETREVPDAIGLRELLRTLELKEDRVAVELNREIVHRDRWPETQLHNQDRLEIVQFVGGG